LLLVQITPNILYANNQNAHTNYLFAVVPSLIMVAAFAWLWLPQYGALRGRGRIGLNLGETSSSAIFQAHDGYMRLKDLFWRLIDRLFV